MQRERVIRFRLAFAVSIIIVVVGLAIAFGDTGSEMAVIGWMFVVVGLLGLVSNLILRDRLR